MGGRTLIIKLTSAQLRFAMLQMGLWLSLAKINNIERSGKTVELVEEVADTEVRVVHDSAQVVANKVADDTTSMSNKQVKPT